MSHFSNINKNLIFLKDVLKTIFVTEIMLDPKFQYLPYIVSLLKLSISSLFYKDFVFEKNQAQEEKDVYETDDVQPVASEYYEEENDNESIDRSKLNTNDAYSKFKGKYLIGNVDFSDNIGRRKNIGYNAV